MALRAGTLLYRLGNAIAWLAFLRAALIVAQPGEGGALRLLTWCVAALTAWLLGRAALYLLTHR